MLWRTDDNRAKRPNRSGFTLIELLIVIVIISILAAIVVPTFNRSKRKAFRASLMSDLRGMAPSQEIYHSTHLSYNADLAVIGAVESDGVTITVNEATNIGWAATATHAGLGSDQCGIYFGTAIAAGGSPGTARSRPSS